jgi:ubiquinone/menaquinone biosynthesis C-methylase UbiE
MFFDRVWSRRNRSVVSANKMTMLDKVKKPVWEMYMRFPYPNYSKEEREQIFAAELTRYHFLGLSNVLANARIIDVGCGTGHRVIPIAKYFGVREYVGIDHSSASLAVAKELAQEIEFKQCVLEEGDLFNLPFPDESFDVVISQGVLHHTSEPYRGFKELVRVCRPGGFVNIYLYNKWNHWRHNMQKARVNRLAGSDIYNRFRVAHGLYGKKPIEEMTPAEIAGFYDQYCHPHKSDHAIGETLGWFNNQGLDYWGSYPALGFLDFIAMAQFRGALLKEHPFIHTKTTAALINLATKLPRCPISGPPFTKPKIRHQLFWQTVYALQGSRGRYSGGPALCGRKPTIQPDAK